jgi:hypothetical protein
MLLRSTDSLFKDSSNVTIELHVLIFTLPRGQAEAREKRLPKVRATMQSHEAPLMRRVAAALRGDRFHPKLSSHRMQWLLDLFAGLQGSHEAF